MRLIHGVGVGVLLLGTVGCGNGGFAPDVGPTVLPAVSSALVNWATSAGGADSKTKTWASAVAVHKDGWSVVVGSMNADTVLYGPGGKSSATLSAPTGTYCGTLARYKKDGTVAWARRLHGSATDSGATAQAVALMTDSDILVAGYFSGTLTLSEGSESKVSFSSTEGGEDIFVARYSADGALKWGRQVGGSGVDQALGVCALDDADGAIVGVIGGEATFGNGESKATTLAPTGDLDAFVAKYDSSGKLMWARAFQSEKTNGYSVAWSVAGNISKGDVVVGGSFAGKEMTVDSGNNDDKTATPLSSVGTSDDVFVAKFNQDGARQWQVGDGGPQYDELFGVAISPVDGAVLLTGGFYGDATFGSTTLDTGEAAHESAFVASYDGNGKFLWATQSDGPAARQGAIGLSVAADSGGGAIVVGWFSDSITGFGGSDHKITSVGAHDAFIVRLKPKDGACDWVIRTGSGEKGESDDAAILGAAIVSASANTKQTVVLCGFFVGGATFGLGETNETTLSGKGAYDAFVVRFTPDGK